MRMTLEVVHFLSVSILIVLVLFPFHLILAGEPMLLELSIFIVIFAPTKSIGNPYYDLTVVEI